jgi:hypothetical protein
LSLVAVVDDFLFLVGWFEFLVLLFIGLSVAEVSIIYLLAYLLTTLPQYSQSIEHAESHLKLQ